MNLQELQEKLASREAFEAELETLRQTAGELEKRLRREQQNLAYENSDVEELEGKTLKALFYTVIGKKEERRMREEDEADAARLQCERTQAELDTVNARIKRVEIELRSIKRAEADYRKFARDLSARIKAVEPHMTEADAMTLTTLNGEIAEQDQKLEYYARVSEAGEALCRCIVSVEEALRDMVYAAKHGGIGAEWETRREVEARRALTLIQAERFTNLLSEGAALSEKYCIDTADLDSMLRRAIIRTYSNAPNADLHVPDIPSLSLNVRGVMQEIERKTARSRSHRADMERRLLALLEKYPMT